jgi:hypothetical protein
MAAMTRKQLYIPARQEKALKRRAKALGISEADLVRRALDLLFRSSESASLPGLPMPVDTCSAREEALAEFLGRARAARERGHRLALGAGRRDELYDERLDRWTQKPKAPEGRG